MPLTDDEVRWILTSDESLNALARRFGKTKQAMSSIRLGRTYQHLATDLPRRLPARSCYSCHSWRGTTDLCGQGVPDVASEGPNFARDCELYQPQR
jgi:hypothetical protein